MTLHDAPRRPRVVPAGRRRRAALALAIGALLLAAAAVVALRGKDDPVAGPPDAAPTLTDLWEGRASLVLDRKWTSTELGRPEGVYGGAHVEIAGGTWYLFSRRWDVQGCPGQSADFRRMGTEVRASPDRGQTWAEPVSILSPTDGTPWACAATDGDAVYDEDKDVWRYMFQCLGASGGWNGCYAERGGESPLGAFAPPDGTANPVIPAGRLWSRICDTPADTCARAAGQRPVSEEGTFNLLPADGGGWWVSFHGYDGTYGFRGIARTRTFRPDGWAAGGADGTPADAVLGPADTVGWHESWQGGGSIGFGAASVIREGRWYYQLAEAADVSLNCTPGQSWDLGLYRSADLGAVDWEQRPGANPLVYSSRAVGPTGLPAGCTVLYPGLFRDPADGTTYVMYGRSSSDPAYDGLYVYRLEWDRNLLHNGDFRTADAQGWNVLEGTTTQRSVERLPDGSPDGTPYLGFNCGGASCDAGQSIYQDVAVSPDQAGMTVAFGGTFRADADAGALDVALLQLDAAGQVIDTTTLPVTTGAAYARARGTVELDDRARRLRFQIYLRSPGTQRADNLYVIPQGGCDEGARFPAC